MLKPLDYSPAAIRFFEQERAGSKLHDAPLTDSSVVFDVGAAQGEWAHAIRNRYGCVVHCFEPNPEDFAVLESRMANDPRVALHRFGLSNRNTEALLGLCGFGSSVFQSAPDYDDVPKVRVQLRDVTEVFFELGLQRLDLLKINIEGGEYDLLDRLLDCGLHLRCDRIRVQFHWWLDKAVRRRRAIRRRLLETHELEWDYPFVWESWVKRA